jgi:hypothetical protein
MPDNKNFFNMPLTKVEVEKNITNDNFKVWMQITVPGIEDFDHRIVQRLLDAAKRGALITVGLPEEVVMPEDVVIKPSDAPVSCTW